jgi:hypothetical protein
MEKFIFILFFFIASFSPKIEKKSATNSVFCFACAECNKVIYFQPSGNDYWPQGFGCKVAGWHTWCNIGLLGNIKSQCKYCKIIVKTDYDARGCVGDGKSCSVSKKKHAFVKIN